MWSNQHTCHKVAKFGQVKQNHKLASTFKLDVAKVTRSEARAQHQAPSTKHQAPSTKQTQASKQTSNKELKSNKQANKQQASKQIPIKSKRSFRNMAWWLLDCKDLVSRVSNPTEDQWRAALEGRLHVLVRCSDGAAKVAPDHLLALSQLGVSFGALVGPSGPSAPNADALDAPHALKPSEVPCSVVPASLTSSASSASSTETAHDCLDSCGSTKLVLEVPFSKSALQTLVELGLERVNQLTHAFAVCLGAHQTFECLAEVFVACYVLGATALLQEDSKISRSSAFDVVATCLCDKAQKSFNDQRPPGSSSREDEGIVFARTSTAEYLTLSKLSMDTALLALFAARPLLKTDEVLRTKLAVTMLGNERVVVLISDSTDKLGFKFACSDTQFCLKQAAVTLHFSEDVSESSSAEATCGSSGTFGAFDVASSTSKFCRSSESFIRASSVESTCNSPCGRYLCVVSTTTISNIKVCMCSLFAWPWTDKAMLTLCVSAGCSAKRLARFASTTEVCTQQAGAFSKQTQVNLVLVLNTSIVVLGLSNRRLVACRRLAKPASKPASKPAQRVKFVAADYVCYNNCSRALVAESDCLHVWRDKAYAAHVQPAYRKAKDMQPAELQVKLARIVDVRRIATRVLVMKHVKHVKQHTDKASTKTTEAKTTKTAKINTSKLLLWSLDLSTEDRLCSGWVEVSGWTGAQHYCIDFDLELLVTTHTEGVSFWSIKDQCLQKQVPNADLRARLNDVLTKTSKAKTRELFLLGVQASNSFVTTWAHNCVFVFRRQDLELSDCFVIENIQSARLLPTLRTEW